MRFKAFFFACLLTQNALATQEIVPPGCVPFVIETDAIQLNSLQAGIILMHNLSAHTVWITHLDNSPPESSQLDSGAWSALKLDKTELSLHCVESKPGHEQEVPCQSLLALCRWIPTTQPKKPNGIFWVGENRKLDALIAYMGRQGFILPSST